MPEAVYPLIAIAVILTVQGFTPSSKLSSRLLSQLSQPQTKKSLKLQQFLTQDLGQNQFQGQWNSNTSAAPLNFFTQTEGMAQILVYSWAIDKKNDTYVPSPYGTMAIRLLDPTYHNKKVIYLIVKLKDYQVGVNEWIGEEESNVFMFDNHAKVDNYTLLIKFHITLQVIKISSQTLNISILLTPLRQYSQLPFVMLIPVLLMLVFIELTKRADIPPQKLSLVTISIIINFLMYISLLEFYRGIELEKWLILNGILTFCLVVRFTQTFQSAIRPINTIKGYMMFYCLSLVYFIGLFNYYHSRLFILLQGLWLIPQIIHNVVLGLRPGFYPSYLAMVLINQFYIIYFKGYHDNVLRESPELFLCFLIIVLDILQIGILYGQHIYGVRFFVPKKLRGNYFDYKKTFDATSAELADDCAICLLPLRLGEVESLETMERLESITEVVPGKMVQIMVTPCGHRFHTICLNHWMEHKLQCPLDSKVLPPVE